jgi:archaetidylinositol phosphate synthase
MRNVQKQISVNPREQTASPERQAAKSVSFKDALRLQESFTAPLERKVLPWLAAKIPAQINSDHLTVLGFLAMFLAGASYSFAYTHRYGLILATVFLALNWFGDSLDGTLARLRNCQRPRYGFYVDHMIDTFGGLFLMGGLALSGFIDWRIALGMFIVFLMLSVQVYLATYTVGIFQLSFAKFGPTEIRLLLAAGNAVLWFRPDTHVFSSSFRLFDVGGIIAIAGMFGMLVVSTIYNTAKLYRAETLS